jgi:DNA-binding NtrC family response regulator
MLPAMHPANGVDNIGNGAPTDDSSNTARNKTPDYDILVVDDDALLRHLLKAFLESAHYAVVAVTDGKEAIQLLACQSIRLVITDVFMPNGDGLELLRNIQNARPGLPVIVISGTDTFDRDLFLRIAVHFGATRTLAKPFGAQDILAVVRDEIGEPARR